MSISAEPCLSLSPTLGRLPRGWRAGDCQLSIYGRSVTWHLRCPASRLTGELKKIRATARRGRHALYLQIERGERSREEIRVMPVQTLRALLVELASHHSVSRWQPDDYRHPAGSRPQYRSNTSGVTGICVAPDAALLPWQVQIKICERQITLCNVATVAEGLPIRQAAEVRRAQIYADIRAGKITPEEVQRYPITRLREFLLSRPVEDGRRTRWQNPPAAGAASAS